MAKEIVTAILGLFFSFMIWGADATAQPNHDSFLPNLIETNAVLSATWWPVSDDTDLLCIVSTPKSKSSGPADSVLSVFVKSQNKFKKIFEYKPDASPLCLFPTEASEGNLVSIWVSGSGYLVYAFAYSDGQIRMVLDSGSKWMPEITRLDTGHRIYKDTIIITELTWSKDSLSEATNLMPSTAIVYEWDGRKYQIIKTVPWEDRFKP